MMFGASGLACVDSVIKVAVTTVATIPTPTITDAYGNVITAAPTIDVRTDDEKDEDMMGILRTNGESLIWLAIIFVIIYMIKGIGK